MVEQVKCFAKKLEVPRFVEPELLCDAKVNVHNARHLKRIPVYERRTAGAACPEDSSRGTYNSSSNRRVPGHGACVRRTGGCGHDRGDRPSIKGGPCKRSSFREVVWLPNQRSRIAMVDIEVRPPSLQGEVERIEDVVGRRKRLRALTGVGC